MQRLYALSSLIIAVSARIKHATINTQNINLMNGVNMIYNSDSVSIFPNEWRVTFANQRSYDLLLSLNNEWGFHPFNPSTITLTINGTNYNHNEGDLLLVFSVSNSEYFAIVIRNEESGQLYKTFPKPLTSPLFQSNVISMLSPSSPDRWHRIINNTNWYNTVPIYRNPVNEFGISSCEWPIKLTISNNPIYDIVKYSHLSYTTDEILYSSMYLSSFSSMNGMDIYIMSDGEGESFGIYDIHIQYQIAMDPTVNPTLPPTIMPTTYSPSTQSPTTMLPTTYSPTYPPQISPTLTPTFSTYSPTKEVVQVLNPTVSGSIDSHLITSKPETETLTPTLTPSQTMNVTLSGRKLSTFAVNMGGEDKETFIATIVAAVIGLILCGFSIMLIGLCIRSEWYEKMEKIRYENSRILRMKIAANNTSTHFELSNINYYNDRQPINVQQEEEEEVEEEEELYELEEPLESETSIEVSNDEEEKEGELITIRTGQSMADMREEKLKLMEMETMNRREMERYVTNALMTSDGFRECSNDRRAYSQNEMSSSSGEHILETMAMTPYHEEL